MMLHLAGLYSKLSSVMLTKMGSPCSGKAVLKSRPGWVGPFRSRTGGLSTLAKLILAKAELLGVLRMSNTVKMTSRGEEKGLEKEGVKTWQVKTLFVRCLHITICLVVEQVMRGENTGD